MTSGGFILNWNERILAGYYEPADHDVGLNNASAVPIETCNGAVSFSPGERMRTHTLASGND